MAVNLAPIGNGFQFFTNTGIPLNGGYINIDDDYTYYKKAQKYLKLLENKFEPDCNDDDYNADSEN